MDELKPCPFCGSDAEVQSTNHYWPYQKPYWVRCRVCGAAVSLHSDEASAIAAWNRRATPDAPRVEDRALADVLTERQRQDAKWGVQDHTPGVWMLILAEEVGEAAEVMSRPEHPHGLAVQFVVEAGEYAKSVLEHERRHVLPMPGRNAVANYRAEMVQVAAVALAAIECLDRDAALLPEVTR